MKVTVAVCEFCQDPTQPTREWEVRLDGVMATVDLCTEHSAPLDRALKAAARPATATKRAGRPRRGVTVVPLEEIEARKTAAAAEA